MAAREWNVPKPAYRWQQNRQKFLSDRLQIVYDRLRASARQETQLILIGSRDHGLAILA